MLEPSDFHVQWHLDYNPKCSFHQIINSTHVTAKVQPPHIKINPKGRPSHKKGAGADSTKRLPSAHKKIKANWGKTHKKRTIKSQPSKPCKKAKQSSLAVEESKASEELYQSEDEGSEGFTSDNNSKKSNLDNDSEKLTSKSETKSKKMEGVK
ncbi:hypothetical protein Pst134EA_002994 [Puccinia striiformis f. sp. tritici]|uniref:hypothetical protein n=1 Tax=Puccinia striiformis f. sp. tritici TaxID=168172 RepID=UPI002007ADB0|nr:hypothetical protein Pst134EA_002994 [Puccinia striiformis f. sp. tritici]KAH9472375.1 hypothetical protein Pst134EA_002994 [Puccinia striiformis f. sp. tritici]